MTTDETNNNPYATPEVVGKKKSTWISYIVTGAVCVSIGFVLLGLLLPAQRRVPPEVVKRISCGRVVGEVGLALHNYQADHGTFPPAYTVDAEGNKLHSWRTLILPYLGEKKLYESIDLTKPWDHPVNAQARETSVKAYRCPSARTPRNQTSYLAILTANSVMQPTRGRTFRDVTDPYGETIMIMEADETFSVPWMAPQDADIGTIKAYLSSNAKRQHSANTFLMMDNRVVPIAPTKTLGEIEAMISIDGGEQIQPE